MSKKDILTNPYRPGDENHLYFNDERILKIFASSLKFMATYFRYQVVGLNNIPKKSRALLVANHGFVPIDMVLLAREIYEKKNRRVRTLAHKRSWTFPVFRELALNMGIVDANQQNAVRLLKRDELVAVFPGGEREGTRPSSQKYQLLWEGRYGFVKTAIQAQSPIIPCMSVGIDDIFHVFEKPSGKDIWSRFFPFPFFLGIGGLPIPRKITHYIGEPITFKAKPQDANNQKIVEEIHAEVMQKCRVLLKSGLRKRRWLGYPPERIPLYLKSIFSQFSKFTPLK